jgi:hypothetical protein
MWGGGAVRRWSGSSSPKDIYCDMRAESLNTLTRKVVHCWATVNVFPQQQKDTTVAMDTHDTILYMLEPVFSIEPIQRI